MTAQSKSGSTIRISWKRARPTQYAMYFNCQTTLVDSFKTMFPSAFKFEGNRALVFDEQDEVPVAALRICVEMALIFNSKTNAKKRERAWRWPRGRPLTLRSLQRLRRTVSARRSDRTCVPPNAVVAFGYFPTARERCGGEL